MRSMVEPAERLAATLLIVAGLAAMSSCQRPLTVLLGPEAAALKAAVEETAALTPDAGKIRVEAEGAKAPAGDLLRLTSTPGWNPPSGSEPAVALPSGWDSSYSPLPALAALGKGRTDPGARFPCS